MNLKSLREKQNTSYFLCKLHLFIKGLYFVLISVFSPVAFFLRSLNIRVLNVKFEVLGHLTIEPDLYLREQNLLKKKHITILFPPYNSMIKENPFSSSVSNRFLLNCWRQHFWVIDNFFLYFLLYPILKSPLLQYSPNHYLAAKASVEHKKESYYTSIYKNSEKESNGLIPFLKLTEKDQKRGRVLLKGLGVPENAWFVCFSVREPGYYTDEDLRCVSCRNSSIQHLELALREILKRGGWCVRVGSPLAASLPPRFMQHSQIIDYVHTDIVGDFMDVFLNSQCRFSIGAMSGITELPRVFGVPCVCPNIVPFGLLSQCAKSIHIFKLQKCKKTGRLLRFSECLKSYLSCSISNEDYEEFQVELIENTPEEIRDAVVEMLDGLDLCLRYSQEDEELQNKFRSLMNSYNPSHQAPARVGKAFLMKYRELLIDL